MEISRVWEGRYQQSTLNRDKLSALPVDIRRRILTYFDSEFVKRDLHGNVSYIGQAALGRIITAASFRKELRWWRNHRFQQVSRQFRDDYMDLFYSLNKFEFGSELLLIGFLESITDRHRQRLTSLRFTLRQHVDRCNVHSHDGPESPIYLMRVIYSHFFSCVNLKELDIRAQIHWRLGKKTSSKCQSLTFPVEDALSHFQGPCLSETPICFGSLIEKEPRRHGYDEDPQTPEPSITPDLRRKVERVKGMLATAFDIVLKERRELDEQERHMREQERQEQQVREQKSDELEGQDWLTGCSTPANVAHEVTDGESWGNPQPLYPWRNEEDMHNALADIEMDLPLKPESIGLSPGPSDEDMQVQCPTHHGIFHPECSICKIEWEQDIDLEIERSVQSQPSLSQASPQRSFYVDPSTPGALSMWFPNHCRILEGSCAQYTAEGTWRVDPEVEGMMQRESPFLQAGVDGPLTPSWSPTAHSPRSHDLLVQRIWSWLDVSKPLYLVPTHDESVFAYYLAMMEWAWDHNLEQRRIDEMTRAILARVDGIAFEAWLHRPSGIPDS